MRIVVAARTSQAHTDPAGLDAQVQQVITWAEQAKHWDVVGVAADYKTGKAYLWDRPNLRPWVTDPGKLAEYDAIVCLKIDRLTRADHEGIAHLEKWARDNGKQVFISSAEVHYPSEGVDAILWDAYIRMAHQEYLTIREQYGRMQEAKHDAGSIVGRPPWGYEIIVFDGVKYIEPTAEGREWVPRIFGWFTDGKSSRWIGEELVRQGVHSTAPGGRWHEARLISMVKRTTYSGTRARKGRSGLEVEPLVSRDLQDKAIAVVASRGRTEAIGTKAPKVLLAKLTCGAPDCPGEGSWPMYRVRNVYYRCYGKGAQRQGCGAPMVDIQTTDALVLNFAEYWDSKPHKSQRFVSGNDTGTRVERLRTELGEAIRVAPSDRIPEISGAYAARIAALESQGPVVSHWEDVETGQTEGQHLRTLDLDGQRDYLARRDIRAWRDAEGRTCITIDGALARKGGPSVIAAD